VKNPIDVSDLATLPVILTLKEIAAIYRISQSTIRRGLQNGTFRPRPWDRYPYRWNRDDVTADLKRRRDEQTTRKHGFASRVRPAKASLDPLQLQQPARRRNPAAS
jgi:hypothetical protein